MKSRKIIVIFLILSISLTGCGNINNKDKTTKNNIEKTVTIKQEKETSINAGNKSEIKMNTYTNSRFGFSIDYPKDFTVKETSTNNDGVKITLGKSHIVVYGSNNVLNDTAKSLYEEKLKNLKKEYIKEKIIKDNYFLISWIDKDMIYCTKTVVGKESINSFTFSYPKDKRKSYDSIAKQIQKSFKTPDINEAH